MIKKFTFDGGIEIEYEDNVLFQHRLIVNKETDPGPWIYKNNEILSYELNGRYFVCQIVIDLLPQCFELIKPKEIHLETIEP